jgi:16S rRNA (adenine1518-N6/adenine1519-N6)-dimethyltransferase
MLMLTPATVHALLTEHGIRPKRSLGQNFLVDPNTARRIAAVAGVEPGDHVLEVGPGLGSLTLALIERGAEVLALELDARLAQVLRSVLESASVDIEPSESRAPRPRAQVQVGDACSVSFPSLLDAASSGHERAWSCVSNLPYNVAVPVVMRVLDDTPAVERMLVMVQREVGERLAAHPGHEHYGAVSVKVSYYAEAAIVGAVPPTVFLPRPKVDSVLVRLERRARPSVSVPSAPELFTLVRAGFAQRRKTLRRSLQPLLGERTGDVLTAAGVAPSSRAEVLGLDEWAALARSAAAA